MLKGVTLKHKVKSRNAIITNFEVDVEDLKKELIQFKTVLNFICF